ncbi:MAG TPA: acyltransferase [Solirubrobacteraceae bacterium]|nr:acyltransferase [Solirubrobacteraceae bacterium]
MASYPAQSDVAPAPQDAAAAAPDALKPPPGNPRFPLFDGLRAIAACTVLITHCAGITAFNTANPLGAYTARLDLGVTIFFLISGFLLYRPFVAARVEGKPPIHVGRFFRRRALRIIPAYWVALTLLSIWPGLDGFSAHPLRYYTFTQIYWLDSTTKGIGPAWTLCVEVSFYLVLPLLAALIARLARGRAHWVRIELGVLAVLTLACLVLRSALQAAGGFSPLQNTLLCFFDWFAYGMALAVLSVAWHRRESQSRTLVTIIRRPWLPWAGAIVVFWVVSTQLGLSRGFFFVFTNFNYQAEHLGYALIAFLLLLPAVFGDWAGGWPRRLLKLRWMAWLGLISYGIYLYQVPLIVWLRVHLQPSVLGMPFPTLVVLAFAVTVLFAAGSYYVVERPMLRFKDPRGPARRRAPSPEGSAPASAG